MPAPSVVFFDLGSTLIWFTGDPEQASQAALRAAEEHLRSAGVDLPQDFAPRYRAYATERQRWRDQHAVEVPAPALLRDALANMDVAAPAPAQIRQTLNAMYAQWQRFWQVEDDAQAAILALHQRGIRTAIISNAGYDEDVQMLVDQAGLRPLMAFILSSAACGYRKPHPAIFELALQRMQIPAGEAMMVGDLLETDVLGANRMGIRSVWLTRRSRSPRSSAPAADRTPAHTISALAELPPLIARLSTEN